MKTVTSKFITKVPKNPPLGRWNIDYCSNKTNTKIDLANEDHCGPCGQYIISKSNESEKIDNTNKNYKSI